MAEKNNKNNPSPEVLPTTQQIIDWLVRYSWVIVVIVLLVVILAVLVRRR